MHTNLSLTPNISFRGHALHDFMPSQAIGPTHFNPSHNGLPTSKPITPGDRHQPTCDLTAAEWNRLLNRPAARQAPPRQVTLIQYQAQSSIANMPRLAGYG